MGWVSIVNLVLTIAGWCWSFVKFVYPYARKSFPYIFCFILGWAACSNRIFSRHKEETLIGTEAVVSVEGGNHLTVRAGLFGRRESDLYLYGLEIPPTVGKQAQENLSKIVSPNDDVRVEVLESWGRYAGIVYAENGNNCCIEQLRAGLAKTTVNRKDFAAAQKEAQKNHRGVWK
ncbi:MAG: thermonuclease family protein [Proteobacteria bacterium]|jgi:hypothetical protein|nr:thermonuclease family protein [Pseudomonadota bacterium]